MITDFFSQLNWAAIAVATLAWFGFSAVWYSVPPLSGAWARAARVDTETDREETPGLVTFLIPTVVGYLVTTIVIALLVKAIGVDTLEEGIVLGLALGVAFALISSAITQMYETKGRLYWVINGLNGLIAFTSSFGASCYMHGPGYGAQKVGVDKFAKDMGVDLKPYNVAAVSIWMGMLRTDRTRRVMDSEPQKYAGFWEIAETPEFTGHVLAALYRDPKRAGKSGQVHIGAELAQEYGVSDEGRQPPSHRPMLGGPHAAHPAVVE